MSSSSSSLPFLRFSLIFWFGLNGETRLTHRWAQAAPASDDDDENSGGGGDGCGGGDCEDKDDDDLPCADDCNEDGDDITDDGWFFYLDKSTMEAESFAHWFSM